MKRSKQNQLQSAMRQKIHIQKPLIRLSPQKAAFHEKLRKQKIT